MRIYFAHAQGDLNLRTLCMFEGIFSLDALIWPEHVTLDYFRPLLWDFD